jgi:putative transcriptional regulator
VGAAPRVAAEPEESRERENSHVFSSQRGRLLVATPELGDPNFDRTVVLLLEHTPEGAVGVVLNRPSGTPLTEAGADWNGWDAFATPPGVVFVGGPVARTAVIAVARILPPGGSGVSPGEPGGSGVSPGEPWGSGVSPGEWKAEGFQPILGDHVGIVDLALEPQGVDAVRLFAGYAGWGGGQLEGEISAGGWFVLDALPSDPLSSDPEELWAGVLRRQGGRLALFAACPTDPSLN